MTNFFDNIMNAITVVVLGTMSGAAVRDEVTAWVTLIGSVAITLTTIGLQIYRLIKDRDKKQNTGEEPEGEETQNDNDERKR